MAEENIPFMENAKLQWLLIGAVFSLPFIIFYAIENPTSTIAMVLFIEPSYTKIKKGYPILDDFESYSSVEEVTSDLALHNYQFTVSAKNLGQGPKPYELKTVDVRYFVHLDQPGALKLIFFNDRLSHATFFPHSVEDYKEELDAELRKPLSLNETRPLGHYILLKFGIEGVDRYYFRWEDRRLITEEMAWQMRYS